MVAWDLMNLHTSITPSKTSSEPEHHPSEKETHFPNFNVSMEISRGEALYPKCSEKVSFYKPVIYLHYLKLTVRTCQEAILKGNNRLPTIHFEVLLLMEEILHEMYKTLQIVG